MTMKLSKLQPKMHMSLNKSNNLDEPMVLVENDYEPQEEDFEEAGESNYEPDMSNHKRKKRHCVQLKEWKRNKNINQCQLGKSYNRAKKDEKSSKYTFKTILFHVHFFTLLIEKC